MSQIIHDITPLISEAIAVFPGDTRFSRKTLMDINDSHIHLSSIETTVHLGAHTDAPVHYKRGGKAIADVDLDRYLGACLVIHAKTPRGERVAKKHLSEKYQTIAKWPCERIIVRTESFPDPNRWNGDFCSLDPELIEEWAKSGVKLVGIDTPSIDPETSKGLESHKMVAKYDLSILEGVVLSEVPEGVYTLIALPLKIAGADASPVRAVLIETAPAT